MSEIHLDTSFLIRALKSGTVEDGAIRGWLAEGRVLSMSTIAWAEFLIGPLTPATAELAHQVVPGRVPFEINEAEVTAMLFNRTGRKRGSLVDCMIAATALSRDVPLATSNAKDFRIFEEMGLRLAVV